MDLVAYIVIISIIACVLAVIWLLFYMADPATYINELELEFPETPHT